MEMSEENLFPSKANADDDSHNDQETEKEILESIAQEDENLASNDLNHSRKKALLEFRCRVEDAILSNYLLGKSHGKSFSRGNYRAKENLRDITLWGIPLLPSNGHEGTDVVLMKFLKAKDFKVSDAFHMLRKTLEWRMEINAEGIHEENFGPDLENMGYMNGVDKRGRPVGYNVYWSINDKEVIKKRFERKEKSKEYLKWKVQFMENGIQKLSFKPGGVDSMIQITDLKNTPGPGPAMREILCVSKKTMLLLHENYPGLVFRNIIVNVPLWFLAFHVLHSMFINQRNKSKFIFARPSKVIETLLKYISPENIPVQYGGLKIENDVDFSPDDKVLEFNVKGGGIENIQIPMAEVGVTVVWDVTVVGYEVSYKDEFVPDDDCSYKILLHNEKKMGETVRNSFHIREPGKIVITIVNRTFKKKRVFMRYKSKPTVPLYNFSSR
ncbi:unnamed protein product [Ilex paraguariensis]|uniref:CRAL-TRIO domain-containing protein n=1 Tax=Ilex paraguariensis TaxID=185542 RepID=A0ABC8R761_9AQUA